MMNHHNIRIAYSVSHAARVAVREFHSALSGTELALVVFFCSSRYDLDALADEMNLCFPNVLVVGCTTAGEISPLGYRQHSISGIGFPVGANRAAVGYMNKLQSFNVEDGQFFAKDLVSQLEANVEPSALGNRCAIQLIDGLAHCEEIVTYAFQRGLGDIPLIGGSAGDDLKFESTWVFCDGRFHADSVVLAIIDTSYPITVFKTQNFIGGQERLVVTKVDTASRTVMEINGLSAAQEYARVLGIRYEDLNDEYFSASPVVVRINGLDYVRSIQKANPDGSLTFYCAIDRGVILKVAQANDFVEDLQHVFDEIQLKIGLPQLVIASDCIFRQLEVEKNSDKDQVERIFKHNNVVGFSTYGEQFMGIHVNQTLTGLAFGFGEDE